MDSVNEKKQIKDSDNDILYSNTVKAGKRIYYIDVKCDRKGEYYLSITESKRLKDQGDSSHFVFEKHKIFLYREDLEKFQQAFNDAADFAIEHTKDEDYPTATTGDESNDEFKLNIEF